MADFNQCHPDNKNQLASGGLNQFTGRSDAAFDALKKSMGTLPTDRNNRPYEVHHLVEQNQTAKFGTEAIQNTANAVALPSSVHSKISSFYSSKAITYGLADPSGASATGTVRENVGNLSYADQRQFGLDTTRRFVNADQTLTTDAKHQISRQLDNLENLNPENCAEVK